MKALDAENCAEYAPMSSVGVNEATNYVDTLIDMGKLVFDKSELGDHVYLQQTSDASG